MWIVFQLDHQDLMIRAQDIRLLPAKDYPSPMHVFDTDDGLIVRQEGRNSRATSDRLNFLFVESDRDTVLATYTRFVAQARDYFARRWQSFRGPNIDAGDFTDLTQEVTLHWMYFYIINRMPVQITETDWEHPQTRRIIQVIVLRRFSPGSNEATALCARLMGLSRDDYLRWREGEELFLNR
jgi:hypothetical protein